MYRKHYLAFLLLFCVIFSVFVISCGDDNPASGEDNNDNGTTTVTQVRFLNSMERVVLGGTKVTYMIRGIAALDTTWPDTIAFGEYSSYVEVDPISIAYNITGEISSDSGATWDTTARWAKSEPVVKNTSHTVTLSFGD